MIKTLKASIPLKVKQSLMAPIDLPSKLRHLQLLRAGVRHLRALPPGSLPDRETLELLRRGWGNEASSASLDYLNEIAIQCLKCKGPILECGSGLTTIILALLAGLRGVEVWSLENHEGWYNRIIKCLQQIDAANTHICLSPLRNYGNFIWYDPPLEHMPSGFDLIVCDGPRARAGGRYGLLPVLGHILADGALIVLDDAERLSETEILKKWQSGWPVNVCIEYEVAKPYASVQYTRSK